MDHIRWNEYNNSEKPALELLINLGYIYKKGKNINPDVDTSERESLREIILKERLIKKIKEFNPWINDTSIKLFLRLLTIPKPHNQIEINEQIWKYLTKKGELIVEQDIKDGRGRRNHSVKIINWDNVDNNEFLVTNQFKVNASKGNRIPDIVIFINGLPLVVIECKSPTITNPLQQAIKQIIEYQDIIPKLFHFNQIIIVTSGQSARAGVIGNSYEPFKAWKEPYPITIDELEKINEKLCRATPRPNPQDVILYGMLEKRNLLDLIRNFIIFERTKRKIVKKIARYQQFRGVNRTIERILTEKEELRGGTIWHTQGSGKSLSMLYTAVKLRRESRLENPLLVFICDRIDLVDQLARTFRHCGFPNPIIPKNAIKLQELIKIGQGVTIVSTIQKFRSDDADERTGISRSGKVYDELTNDENIFVLVDEAHRSQYKIFASNMRTGLPNACYIAYTGTPLAQNEKKQLISVGKGKTVKRFGAFIDVYNMRQSVKDKMTLDIFYENRLPELRVEGESIDHIFDRVFADKSDKEREEIKKKYATKDKILAAPERIKKVVWDIINHYEEKIGPNGFKAQIVVSSRELAILYKKYLDEFDAPESAVIISSMRMDDELKKYNVPYITNKSEQREYIDRFTSENDPLKFIIVCDMLITGFDAPIEQVMYLDKSLKEHNLLQAIARVNRTYKQKVYGLVVDYYGVSHNLDEALKIFEDADIKGVMKPIDSELPRLELRHKNALSYFEGVDMNDLEACIEVLEPEDVRNDFYTDFKLFSQSLDIVLPSPKAQPYIYDLRKLGKLTIAAKNRFRDEQLDITECGAKVKKIIDDHIRSNRITQLVEPVSILSDKFQEVLDNLKSDKAKASEMQHAIHHEITLKIEEDPVFYTSLKEKLEKIIEDYRENRITLAERIKQIKQIVNMIRANPTMAERMGLNKGEMALFRLLKKELNESKINFDPEIVKFTYKILEVIEPYTSLIDWQLKNDILRQIRRDAKLVFQKYPIDRSRYNPLAKLIVDLAKVHYT